LLRTTAGHRWPIRKVEWKWKELPSNGTGERQPRIGASIASDSKKVLVVVHTVRGERIRIISARSATKHEKRDYEEATR
jgi:uncharacterized DUF497 family protein